MTLVGAGAEKRLGSVRLRYPLAHAKAGTEGRPWLIRVWHMLYVAGGSSGGKTGVIPYMAADSVKEHKIWGWEQAPPGQAEAFLSTCLNLVWE